MCTSFYTLGVESVRVLIDRGSIMCSEGNGKAANGNGNGSNGNSSRPRLTDLQRAFVDAYMGEARYNATEAAAMAGYSGNRNTLRSMAAENMAKPAIQQEIRRRWSAHGVNEEEISTRLADWMRFDPSVLFDPHGGLSYEQVKKHARYIKRVWWDSKGRLCIELYDAMDAAINIGKMLGMYRPDEPEKVEHSGEVVWTWAKPPDHPEEN